MIENSKIYLDKEVQQKAKEFFEEYGMSLSEGINFLLKKVIEKKEPLFFIEPIYKNDKEYKEVKRLKEEYINNPSEFIEFDDIKWN